MNLYEWLDDWQKEIKLLAIGRKANLKKSRVDSYHRLGKFAPHEEKEIIKVLESMTNISFEVK